MYLVVFVMSLGIVIIPNSDKYSGDLLLQMYADLNPL